MRGDGARRRLSGTRRTVGFSLALVFAAVLAGVAVLYGISENLAQQVPRLPGVFNGLGQRPGRPVPDDGSLTFLLVGSDSRAAEPSTGTAASAGGGDQRSDVIMLARVAGDGSSAEVVSIPRDSWVTIPGHGPDKINAAFNYGGPGLLVQTVEQLTGVHVDHFATLDFGGFEGMVDAVGGVDVAVAEPTMAGNVALHQGENHLDGRSALSYVRQRYGLPRGDLDRVQRQQNLLRALMSKVASEEVLDDPARTYDLITAMTKVVSVDSTLTNNDLRSLAMRLRALRGNRVTFVTAPVAGVGDEDGLSVVRLDTQLGPEFWRAFSSGSMPSYLSRHPADTLPGIPR